MLIYLPQELLLIVIWELDRSDLDRLRGASKYLYRIITPILHRRIKIATYGPLIDHLDVKSLLRATNGRENNLLHYAGDFMVVSAFRTYCHRRCPHFAEDVFSECDDCRDVEDPANLCSSENLTKLEAFDKARWMDNGYEASIGTHFNRLKNRCLSVLIKCKEGGLKSFGWGLGACVPAAILGEGGYLPTRQKSLEKLILVTDGNCSHTEDNRFDLKPFTKLTVLSWTGLRFHGDFQALRGCFEATSHQLESLKLDVFTWQHMCHLNPYAHLKKGTYLAQDVLQLSSAAKQKCVFPVIADLSLNGLSLVSAEKELAFAFNFSSLRFLKLRFCPGWGSFLRHGMSLDKPIQLMRLIVQSDGENHSLDGPNDSDGDKFRQNFDNTYEVSLEPTCYDSPESVRDLCAFLENVNNLQDLQICINNPAGVLPIWEILVRHRTSLKSLVYHQRWKNLDIPSPSFEVDDMSILGHHSRSPLSSLNLECLGLCCGSEELSRLNYMVCGSDWAQPSNSAFYDHEVDDWETRLVVVDENYIPRDYAAPTEYFNEFAQWVFGPQGVPSLQILVYGDWSNHGRYKETRLIFCRDVASSHTAAGGKKNYRSLNASDESLWDLIVHAVQDYPEEPRNATTQLEGLQDVLGVLHGVLQRSDILLNGNPAMGVVAKNILVCENGLQKLKTILDKCEASHGPQDKTKRARLNRALYPFQRGTIKSLLQHVDSLKANLGTSMQALQLSLSLEHMDKTRLVLVQTEYTATESAKISNYAGAIDRRLMEMGSHSSGQNNQLKSSHDGPRDINNDLAWVDTLPMIPQRGLDNPAFELVRATGLELRDGPSPDLIRNFLSQLRSIYQDQRASPKDICGIGYSTMLHEIMKWVRSLPEDMIEDYHNLIKCFIAFGVPVNEPNKYSETAVDVLISAGLWDFDDRSKSFQNSLLTLITNMISSGMDTRPDFQGNFRFTRVMTFNPTLLIQEKLVIEDYQSMDGCFELAIGWPQGLQILLEATHDSPKTMLLHSAIEARCLDSVNILLMDGKTPIILTHLKAAQRSGVSEIFDLILDRLVKRRRQLQLLAERHLPVQVSNRLKLCSDSLPDSNAARVYETLQTHGIPMDSNLRAEEKCTVYCYINEDCRAAQKLLDAGFRNIEEEENGMSILMWVCYTTADNPFGNDFAHLNRLLDFLGFLISKGADLYMRRRGDNFTTLHFFGRHVIRTLQGLWRRLHMGHGPYRPLAQASSFEIQECFLGRIRKECSQIKQDSRDLLRTFFMDDHCDTCSCACSAQGCVPSTALFSKILLWTDEVPNVQMMAGMILVLSEFMKEESVQSCHDRLAPAVIRLCTFHKLNLTHTCHSKSRNLGPDDMEEILEEERFSIRELEMLTTEFTSKYHELGLGLPEFLIEFWTPRMEDVPTPDAEEIQRIRSVGVKPVGNIF
ncbi:hypothetical protein FE257_009586 [Aspergillus nanangensis]|uniref:F-box domain-containing protein n=1 Tax=Aspergillus nanangensis TaxID=2582783 RepID=A0AAD4CJR9_ASPNN|nr:hypothetical protein FE257_009586 [Aspergillus nanangensis]